MTLIVILKPPHNKQDLGGCNSDINLYAERIDYTINNDIQHKRTGTEEGRAAQLISGQIQINITGVCIEENGNTAMQNAEILECATNKWNKNTKPSNPKGYPRINWRIGNEYILIQKLTFIDEAGMNGNEISYLLTVYVDTRE